MKNSMLMAFALTPVIALTACANKSGDTTARLTKTDMESKIQEDMSDLYSTMLKDSTSKAKEDDVSYEHSADIKTGNGSSKNAQGSGLVSASSSKLYMFDGVYMRPGYWNYVMRILEKVDKNNKNLKLKKQKDLKKDEVETAKEQLPPGKLIEAIPIDESDKADIKDAKTVNTGNESSDEGQHHSENTDSGNLAYHSEDAKESKTQNKVEEQASEAVQESTVEAQNTTNTAEKEAAERRQEEAAYKQPQEAYRQPEAAVSVPSEQAELPSPPVQEEQSWQDAPADADKKASESETAENKPEEPASMPEEQHAPEVTQAEASADPSDYVGCDIQSFAAVAGGAVEFAGYAPSLEGDGQEGIYVCRDKVIYTHSSYAGGPDIITGTGAL